MRLALGFLVLGAVGCAVTSDGSTGDEPHVPSKDPLGTGARLRNVVGEADWYEPGNMESQGCDAPDNEHIELSGQVIVAIDRFDETGDGAAGNIYVEDVYFDGEDPEPYSGMTIFNPAFTPPDLRLFESDVVDTVGNLQEFLGPTSGKFGDCMTLPEVGGTMSFRFENGPLEPLTLVKENGGAGRWEKVIGYPNARRWIGMLVRFEGIRISSNPSVDGAGRFSASIDMGGGLQGSDVIDISNELFDVASEGPAMEKDTTFSAVTGVLTYFYGFRIAPRSADDFEP